LTLALLFATSVKAESNQLLETPVSASIIDLNLSSIPDDAEELEYLTPNGGLVPKDEAINDALDNWIKYAARTNMQRILQKEGKLKVY